MDAVKPSVDSNMAQSLDSGKFSPEDTYIAVMGVTGAGKSTFISKCCQEAVKGIGHSLKSMTQEISLFTFYLNRKKIHLIDTPGFDDTYRTDSDVLRDLAYWLSASYGRGFKLTGIIYLHPITATRMNGAAFKNLRTFQKLCGKQSMASIVLVTTMWANVTIDEGDSREIDLKSSEEFWGNMIRQGSCTFRHTGDHHSAMNIISHLLDKKTTTVLELQTEMVDKGRTLDDTEAGREVEGEMIKQRQVFERRLLATKQDMEEAIANKDKEHIEQIAKEQEKTQAQIDAIQKGREELKTSMEKLIQDKEQQHQREMEDIAKKLSDQRAETDKNVKDFQEYKDFMTAKQEQEDKKRAAMEAELDTAKAQAQQSDADSVTILQGALLAMQHQKEQAEEEKRQMVEEARIRESKIAESEAFQSKYQRQQESMQFNAMMAQQQQYAYANAQAYAQQQQEMMMMSQSSMNQSSFNSSSIMTGVGLAGEAMAAMAVASACSMM